MAEASPSTAIALRHPDSPFSPPHKVPTRPYIMGTWHKTHASDPLWKDKRNVSIQYTPLDSSEKPTSPEHCTQIGDEVTYQEWSTYSNCWKDKSISGTDKWEYEVWEEGEGKFLWRGKGWLKIATCESRILGSGSESSGRRWMCRWFAKTIFTPVGVDIVCDHAEGLREETVKGIIDALKALGDPSIMELAKKVYKVDGSQYG